MNEIPHSLLRSRLVFAGHDFNRHLLPGALRPLTLEHGFALAISSAA